jgi:hypothetical protein
MSFVFQLVREDEGLPPMVVFQDSTTPGLVPVWEAVGAYDALYNSDGRLGRDVSRAIAYGLDRVTEDTSLAQLMPPGGSPAVAIRFLENVHLACPLDAARRLAGGGNPLPRERQPRLHHAWRRLDPDPLTACFGSQATSFCLTIAEISQLGGSFATLVCYLLCNNDKETRCASTTPSGTSPPWRHPAC